MGRALGLDDLVIQHIEINEELDAYQKCYAMLKKWIKTSTSANPEQLLVQALKHDTVKRSDLGAEYFDWLTRTPKTSCGESFITVNLL